MTFLTRTLKFECSSCNLSINLFINIKKKKKDLKEKIPLKKTPIAKKHKICESKEKVNLYDTLFIMVIFYDGVF